MFVAKRLTISLLLIACALMSSPSLSWGRGFGGMHGGGGARLGGLGGGALAGRAGGLGGLEGSMPGAAARLGEGGGRLSNLNLSGAGLSGLSGYRAGIASDLSARGIGAGALAGSGLGARSGALSNLSGLGGGGAPTRSQISNFLGLPSDNGLHGLSGETQSRLSQAYDKAKTGDGPLSDFISGESQDKLSQLYDKAKSGDGPLSKNLSGETQSKLSQLYDNVKAGDGPLSNFIPGETQSKLSKLYDNVKAGDGPFSNFIPGETQKPLSRLYDDIRAGNHPFRPMSPWIIHNNAIIIRRNFNNYFIFTPGWYRRYPAAWYPAVWAYGNPWLYAPWPTLGVWLGCPAGQPVYYDYGTNVVNQDNSIYVNGQDAGTTEQYYQQAQDLAEAGADSGDSASGQWMPLGVFAISEKGQTSANLILQLAVNKQGVIRGNMTNTKSDKNRIVQGSVNKQTERAAWTVGDDTKTVFETGIYNLTKDQTPVIVHFGDSKTEQVLLVRLDQKDQGKSQDQQSGASQSP